MLKKNVNAIERKMVNRILKLPKFAHWLSVNYLSFYLRLFYFNWQGKHLKLRHPQDFNQWLLRTSWENSLKPQMSHMIPLCVDKFSVREYIASKGYADTLNEVYGIYDNVNDIDWKNLPEQFVMKMTNASARNYICVNKNEDEVKWKEIKACFGEWLCDNSFGWESGEWQYSKIKPRIVVEKYLKNLGEDSLVDYKFHCVKGKMISCFVCYNRNPYNPHSEVSFDDYDRNWVRTDAIKDIWHPNRRIVNKPSQWTQMIEMAECCTQDFPYCRFDLYEVNDKILFGEMTFTPHGCVMEYYKDEWLKNTLKIFING